MKNYKLILMLGVLCLSGCSHKDESPKSTSKKTVTISKAVVPKIVLKQSLQARETISKDYIQSIENELKKMENSKEVKKIENKVNKTSDELKTTVPEVKTIPDEVKIIEELTPISTPTSTPLVFIPDHIKNSTIESVPR